MLTAHDNTYMYQ